MEFEAVIGLEIHAQISTRTKLFCRCDNDSFEKVANTNVCPICMGFPGQLPMINTLAVEKGVIAALALNGTIPEMCKFDRKNYFYPDLPMGFQISQYDKPLSVGGYVEVEVRDSAESEPYVKKITLTRLHLENDAGKLTHISSGTLVDFNRAGTPLMEIVSEPDIRSAAEACAYAREVQRILRYVGSSEADMEKGMMRFDASVSIRPVGEEKLYPRAEIKNLNSFRSLEAAIEYEISRQRALWEEGSALSSPITVGWSDERGQTYFLRDKEESDDYRYFPEPDLPPLVFEAKQIAHYRSLKPELPRQKKLRYISEWGISEDDARILSDDLTRAEYFEEVVRRTNDPRRAVSFITTILMKHLNEELISINEQKVSAELMAELIDLVNSDEISTNAAKGEIFDAMYESGARPSEIVRERGLTQVSDSSAIEEICKKIIKANPASVADVQGGKEKAIGFLIGQVMKEMKGQGNPQTVSDVMRKLLGV